MIDNAVLAKFEEDKVRPQHRAVFNTIRTAILTCAPQLEERMRGGTETYYGVPVYRLKRDIIALSPNAKGITISFTKGAQFIDPAGHLGGTGKASRTLAYSSKEGFDEQVLCDFVRQAIEVDEK
ncbi:DUF1801 domain-containing protein [Alteriqipengyuania sp.]|uniref:DUF1801 domain-containing protein n=1 Tax=Alteriqipengyuania sp. TaxID=2800692 RepID=UPI0035114A40